MTNLVWRVVIVKFSPGREVRNTHTYSHEYNRTLIAFIFSHFLIIKRLFLKLGTPIGTDSYIKDFVTQNSTKIMRDVEKFEPLTDYNLDTPRTILIGVTHSYRYSHHKSYTPERHSRFFPSLGQGCLRFGGDHPPKVSRSRWFWFDSECPRANLCQGRYGIPILVIGRILTPKGTKTLDPE